MSFEDVGGLQFGLNGPICKYSEIQIKENSKLQILDQNY